MPEASVLVDGHAPTLREANGTWHDEVTINNTPGPVRRSVQIQANRPNASVTGTDLIMNQTGSRYILPANEVLTHDADGNLTSDGHWTYTWDAENRLIAIEEKTSTRQPPGLMVRQRLEFRYDAGGRRIAKKVLHAEGNGTFVLKSSQVFLYDGWNMIGEFSLQNSAFILQRSYEWGPDVSGSFIGAGGVGGLILIRQPLQPSILRNITSKDEPQTAFAPCYDGNGNVTELCALSTQTITARYEYSAFGETITVDGSAIADANPFRFSTKYEDRETGFYYYGYRYYAPETGRWLSKDPIGESGGVNLYGMIENDTVNEVDYLGLNSTQSDSWQESINFPGLGGVSVVMKVSCDEGMTMVDSTLSGSDGLGIDLKGIGAGHRLIKATVVFREPDAYVVDNGLSRSANGVEDQGYEWEFTGVIDAFPYKQTGIGAQFTYPADPVKNHMVTRKLICPCNKQPPKGQGSSSEAKGGEGSKIEPPELGDKPKPKPKPKGRPKGK